MSKKLYLYKDGKPVLRLAFGQDDLPVLKAWYENAIKMSGMPEFKDLSLDTMNNMANTVAFNLFRKRYRFNELIITIKNTFTWKKK
jgi:hypothetical protein